MDLKTMKVEEVGPLLQSQFAPPNRWPGPCGHENYGLDDPWMQGRNSSNHCPFCRVQPAVWRCYTGDATQHTGSRGRLCRVMTGLVSGNSNLSSERVVVKSQKRRLSISLQVVVKAPKAVTAKDIRAQVKLAFPNYWTAKFKGPQAAKYLPTRAEIINRLYGADCSNETRVQAEKEIGRKLTSLRQQATRKKQLLQLQGMLERNYEIPKRPAWLEAKVGTAIASKWLATLTRVKPAFCPARR